MGQVDARRLQFDPCRELTSAVNDDRQTLTNTGLFKVGDIIVFYDKDANGCLGTALGTRTVTAICPNAAIIYDSPIDLTTVTGTATICNQNIDDVQEALARLYECFVQPKDQAWLLCETISASVPDAPIGGQQEITIGANECFFEAGDTVNVICDSGLVISGATVISRNGGVVVIDDNTDLSAETGCKLCNTSLTVEIALERLRASINFDFADCEDLDAADCSNTAYEFDNVFLQNTSVVYLDGVAKKKGTCGTRATVDFGAFGSNDGLRFTSMILGLAGNDIDVEVVSAAGLTVTVTGSFSGGDYLIQVNNNSDTATAEQIADAINADATAKRLIQAQFGGDGTGLPAAAGPTALASGANDGTGDYCEIEQVTNNAISGTGFKWISFHIRPLEGNRMNLPPRDTEELWTNYRIPC